MERREFRPIFGPCVHHFRGRQSRREHAPGTRPRNTLAFLRIQRTFSASSHRRSAHHSPPLSSYPASSGSPLLPRTSTPAVDAPRPHPYDEASHLTRSNSAPRSRHPSRAGSPTGRPERPSRHSHAAHNPIRRARHSSPVTSRSFCRDFRVTAVTGRTRVQVHQVEVRFCGRIRQPRRQEPSTSRIVKLGRQVTRQKRSACARGWDSEQLERDPARRTSHFPVQTWPYPPNRRCTTPST